VIEPHGGRLVDRVADETHAQQLRSQTEDAPEISLSVSQYQDLVNIATGRFSPIDGFLSRNDFLKVAHDMTLEDGTVWPLPITLDVSVAVADELTPGKHARLRGPDDSLLGTIEVEEVYKHNKEETVKPIFGTDDTSHPGVARYLSQEDFLVGGPVYLFEEQRYNSRDLLPRESRVLFEHRGWETVVGFQTRNAPHRAHEYIRNPRWNSLTVCSSSQSSATRRNTTTATRPSSAPTRR
jgi:sulfate adenylyltransferase